MRTVTERNRTRNLDSAFAPASIAIAGVGPMSAGKCYLDSLHDSGYKGDIYALNNKGGNMDGMVLYRSINDVPGQVDLVISCIPAAHVVQLLRGSAEKGVKVVAMFTSGFSETGRAGAKNIEAEIASLARSTGVRVIGPNCMGVYSPKAGVSFVSDFPKEAGKVAFVCQSGGHAIYVTRLAAERGVRFSKVVSYGNASDVNETDLFEYLATDEETEIVAAYIEGIKDGARFRNAVRTLAAKKPVIILKGGQTPEGARTAASHTSSLAGSDRVWDSLFRQAGVIRVYGLHEMVDMLVTFTFMPLPRGRRLAMVGGGGGASVLATDAGAANGFVLPPVPAEVREQFSSFLDSDAGLILTNPVELNMFPDMEFSVARTMLAHETYDFMLANLVFGQQPWPAFDTWFDLVTDTALKLRATISKPVGVILDSHLAKEAAHFKAVENKCVQSRIPVYHNMLSACRAIDRFMKHQANNGRKPL